MRQLLLNLTARPALVAALLFVVGFGLTAALPARFGWPQPVLHDEFAYVFEGETFARGRLTNPPPVGPPEFFETFHHLISPVYIGKFPPGQGLALALGVLLGHAIIGVWIVNGLWAAALYWLLRAFAPPRWALLGAVAGIATYGAFSYFGQTYWGGSVLALGGTLTFGGALRLLRRRGCPYSASTFAGLGCGLMALSRPLDGFIFAVYPAAVIVWLAFRPSPHRRPTTMGRLLSFLVPAFLGVVLLLGYNVATTGRALLFAHRLYDNTFVPRLVLFVWQKPPPPDPATPAYLADYENAYSSTMSADPLPWDIHLADALFFAENQREFFLPFPILPFFAVGLFAAFRWRNRVARFAVGSLLFLIIPFAILRYYNFPHYAAAWSAPILVLIIQGARSACLLLRHRLRPRWLPFTVAAVLLFAAPASAVLGVLYRGAPGWQNPPYYYALDRLHLTDQLTRRFEATGRRQLVVVAYPPGHNPHDEWVFNSPDPSAQPVLWARAISPLRDQTLFAAYPNYDHWFLLTGQNGRFLPNQFHLLAPISTSSSAQALAPSPLSSPPSAPALSP